MDYVLNETKWKNLTFIGHSQGTTQMFTALAENFGDMKSKINFFVGLAPITIPYGPQLYAVSFIFPYIKILLDMLNVHELFTQGWQD